MSFIGRTYPDVVRDLLTGLTQGVTGEVHRVQDYDARGRPPVLPEVVLERRPVRRVSFVSGYVEPPTPDEEPIPHVFTRNDYELLPVSADGGDESKIRFLAFGRKPAPNTDLVVNYYPRNADPAPVTDLNVGSVVRTVSEALARELALQWVKLDLAYDSGFVETATGASLDRVVALLGYRRFEAGRPVGTVTFQRRAGLQGSITIPAGTPVADPADKVRYETVETHEMLAGESTAQVRVRGIGERTPAVEAGTLTVIQRAIAGLEAVTNERPTTRASADETDAELRARAQAALLASDKGTVAAITFGLQQLPEVRAARVVEMPSGVPGEIQVLVTLKSPGPLPPSVSARIEELRPAGIRVLAGTAGTAELTAKVGLLLEGAPRSDVAPIEAASRRRLVEEINRKGVGETVRMRPLVASLLADERVADAAIALAEKGGAAAAEGADFVPRPGTTVQLAEADVAFEPARFEQGPPATGAVPLEVKARATLILLHSFTVLEAEAALTARLRAFFAAQTVGASVDVGALLTALRDEAHYGLDPLGLVVTLTAGDQFFQIAQGGPSFTVRAGQTFDVGSVEVTEQVAP